jgi:hypothetical protein
VEKRGDINALSQKGKRLAHRFESARELSWLPQLATPLPLAKPFETAQTQNNEVIVKMYLS